jgi:NAD(P)-dependent dehydrogenase (short-subunit alcohol dehydrogenase family)
MAPLAGKSVLVIGGSSGMGFAVARAALAEGASVVIASSSATKLEAAASKLVSTTGHGDRLKWHILDLNDEESFKTLFDDIGKVDHLIHTVRCMRNFVTQGLLGLTLNIRLEARHRSCRPSLTLT